MSRYINLIPKDFNQSLSVRTSRRRALVAALCTVVAVGGWGIAEGMMLRRDRLTLARLSAEASVLDTINAELTTVRTSVTNLQTQLAWQAQVGLPLEVSRVIAAIANMMDDGMVLTRLTMNAGPPPRNWAATDSRKPTTLRERQSAISRSAQPEVSRVLIGAVEGQVCDATSLSAFLERLERRSPFSHVQMEYARPGRNLPEGFQEFRISFAINLDVLYDVQDEPVTVEAPAVDDFWSQQP